MLSWWKAKERRLPENELKLSKAKTKELFFSIIPQPGKGGY
jgi:hypothetical protein